MLYVLTILLQERKQNQQEDIVPPQLILFKVFEV